MLNVPVVIPPDKSTAKINSKHTVSLGSAVFLALTIIGGFMTNYGTRNARLFYLLPIQLTSILVFVPLFIIYSNQKLKDHFLQNISKFLKLQFNCLKNNSIEPNIFILSNYKQTNLALLFVSTTGSMDATHMHRE